MQTSQPTPVFTSAERNILTDHNAGFVSHVTSGPTTTLTYNQLPPNEPPPSYDTIVQQTPACVQDQYGTQVQTKGFGFGLDN